MISKRKKRRQRVLVTFEDSKPRHVIMRITFTPAVKNKPVTLRQSRQRCGVVKLFLDSVKRESEERKAA